MAEATEDGVSVRHIAEVTGLSYSSLLRFMHSKQSLRLGSADRLAKYFRISHIRDFSSLTDRPVLSADHVAYHEAGHAVASVVLRLPFRYVTVRSNADSLGHLLHRSFSKRFNPDYDVRPHDVDFIERFAVCCYAGAAAVGIVTGKEFDWTCAGQDGKDAMDLVSYVDFESDALGAHLALLSYRARNLVRVHSKAVKRVADRLCSEETLKAKAVKALVWPQLGAVDLKKLSVCLIREPTPE